MFVFSNLFKVMEIYEIYTKTEKQFMQHLCNFNSYLFLAQCIIEPDKRQRYLYENRRVVVGNFEHIIM